MRDIKFRTWCKSDFSTKDGPLKFEQKITDEGDLVFCYDDICYSFEVAFLDKDNWIIEQYTGLKDKNGKEIYEGDIVLVRDYEARVWKNVNGEVVWKNQRIRITGEVKFGQHSATTDDQYCKGKAYGWYLKLSRDPKDKYRKSVKESLNNSDGTWSTNDFCSTKAKDIEVIGNIHENPELLK